MASAEAARPPGDQPRTVVELAPFTTAVALLAILSDRTALGLVTLAGLLVLAVGAVGRGPAV